MKKKPWIIILIILLIIGLGVGGYYYYKNKIANKPQDQISQDEGKVKSGLTSKNKEFTASDSSFSIVFPKDWIISGKSNNANAKIQYDYLIINSNDPNVFIGINGPKNREADFTTDFEGLKNAIAAKLKADFEGQKTTFELKDAEVSKNNNYDQISLTYKLTNSSDQGGKSTVQMIRNVLGEKNIFVLTASVPANKFEDYQKTIEEIVNSFSLK